jgi:hypothetical protein
VLQFIGGAGSSSSMSGGLGGLDPSRCAGGIDVGKSEASCLITDHRGEVVGNALTFRLKEPGVRALEAELKTAAAPRAAARCGRGADCRPLPPLRGGTAGYGLPLSQCDHFAGAASRELA